jgi:hypothetical protein
MWTVGMPIIYRTARTMCELTGVDPDGPTPADGHVLHEIGYPACKQAARDALAPHAHQAHIREIGAFRRIALGKPWSRPPTSASSRVATTPTTPTHRPDKLDLDLDGLD